MTKQGKSSRTARRRKSREEAMIRKHLGYTKAQWDALRAKKRRTAADDMKARFKECLVNVFDMGLAAQVAMNLRLGRMLDRAALTERDRGALELMAMILDEAERPGVLLDRLREELRTDLGLAPAGPQEEGSS